MSTPNVRLIRDDEQNALLELYGHLHPSDDPLPSRSVLDSVWGDVRSTPGVHIVVAELDGTLVSSCALCVIPNLTRGCRPYGLIENVVTHGDFRRSGFGGLVVRRALEIAWSRNCYKVMLLTGWPDPSTDRFYEACGFVAGEKTGFVARPPSTN